MHSFNTLGIDLGTSEVKVLVMGADGAVLSVGHSPLTYQQPHPGWAEQDPESWWSGVIDACSQARAAAPEAYAAVRAVGLSGQMHGATLLNEAHQVLRPCILWNDSRSEAQCLALTRDFEALHAITGNLAMPGFTAPKLLWLRDNEAELFKQIATVLLPKDYLRLRLTGRLVSEMSDAAGTLWLDVGRRDWSDALLQATGLTREHMPSLVEGSQVSGDLTPQAAQLLGLQSGIPVAGGAGDNAASAIGVGAVRPGDSFVSLGTSGVLFSVTDSHRPNVQDAVHAFCHALPGTWHQMTVMLSAASALRWITQATGYPSEAALLAEVAVLTAAQRAAAPLFLPYLSGERTPHNDVAASGSFIGLRHSHRAADMAYAVIEGVSLGMRDGLNALQRAGTQVRAVQLVGGGSRSPLWAQLLADAMDVNVTIGPDSGVGAALGAARLARLCVVGGSAAHIEAICTQPGASQVFAPALAGVRRSERRHALFQSSYQSLRPVFRLAAQ